MIYSSFGRRIGVMKISRIGIIWNSAKSGAEACLDTVIAAAEKHGVATQISKNHPIDGDVLAGTQICCVIGGDGTILGAVESAVRNHVPIFGINLGKLGYLANYSAENIERDLDDIFNGNYRTVSRTLLECKFADDPEELRRYALNDIVIKAWENFQMTALRVDSVEHGTINTFRGDGLIFTTPTGSTAYSLGAGGPLIHSDAEVFALTPLCPHTLSNRAVVFPRNMEIRVDNVSDNVPVGISLDGNAPLPGKNAFPLSVKMADERVEILQPTTLSEFEILRTKLRWV